MFVQYIFITPYDDLVTRIWHLIPQACDTSARAPNVLIESSEPSKIGYSWVTRAQQAHDFNMEINKSIGEGWISRSTDSNDRVE